MKNKKPMLSREELLKKFIVEPRTRIIAIQKEEWDLLCDIMLDHKANIEMLYNEISKLKRDTK